MGGVEDLTGLTPEEVFAIMDEDDFQDRVAEQTLASPIDYARSRGIRPQKVYSYLRAGKLEAAFCPCGRKCVVIAEADKVFRKGSDDG